MNILKTKKTIERNEMMAYIWLTDYNEKRLEKMAKAEKLMPESLLSDLLDQEEERRKAIDEFFEEHENSGELFFKELQI